MWFYRNYTPEYKDPEKFLKFIKEEIEKTQHKIYLRQNDFPYNCKWLVQNINTDHITMWYTKETDKDWIWFEEQQLLKAWYCMREVPMQEKSIKFPHRHFIRLAI